MNASYEEGFGKQEGYESIANELKSLESRISDMASKRSDETSPTNIYITEKLKFLESKLHELSQNKEEKETEKIILEKLGKIEDRLNTMSKVNKEESINELKEEKKKIKIKGTDDV